MDNRTTVIIADNSEELCAGLKSALQRSDGFGVLCTAQDGEQAIKLVKEHKPDILVLDMMLPERDGIAVLRDINGMEKKPTVIATSSFVTDYVAAEAAIVASNEAPGANVTGYSDMSDIAAHVELTQKLCPTAKTVAIIYCSAEPNSVIQGNQAEELYKAAGFTTVTLTASDITTISTVVTSACDQADVIYIPTDNTAANASELIGGVVGDTPIFAGEEGICKGCGVATLSIDYYDLGYKTGEMAAKILKGEAKFREGFFVCGS